MRIVKPILCCALLTIPAAHGEPRHFSANNAPIVPPKARPVTGHPTKEKIYVSVSGATTVAKPKSAQATKSATPKAVNARTTANNWHFTPKFEEGGKDDTTYGFMLHHRF